MTDAVSSVGGAIQALLTQALPPVAGADATLAFQPIGLPIEPGDFDGTAVAATAALDALADVTAKVAGGQFQSTLITATGLFNLLLSGMVESAGDAATYGQLLNQAQEAYYGGVTDTLASPSDWWDSSASGWTSYSTSSGEPSGQGAAGPVAGVPWNWRIAPASQLPALAVTPPSLFRSFHPLPVTAFAPLSAASTSSAAASSAPSAVVDGSARDEPVSAASAVALTALTSTSPAATAAAAPTAGPAESSRGVLPLLGLARGQLAGLASSATPAPVQADQLSVSFDYAVATLSRPWWNDLLVTNKDWYLPGYAAGDLAPGSLDGARALCGGLPTAMVLVRNLSIAGSWTQADQASLPQAATFGPFSLLGRTISADLTVQVAGVQLIAWAVSELPQLPPLSDPSLSTSASPDPLTVLPVLTAGSTGPFVSRAQALLGALLAPATSSPAVTGTFDSATAAAVGAFQNASHIAATGEIDLATWHQLIGI